ncbi:hypothetical protein BDW62DRAFT_22416 [Aspergillus aurantiobrunneus]
MSTKVGHAAFVEEYDEDAHVSLPETRQVANVTAKRSKSDLKKSAREHPFVEAASDSGYSSRTAATGNSTQSAPSGQKPPVPLKVDTSLRRTDLERTRSRTKERPRDRSARPSRDDKMHAGPYSAGYPPVHLQRSPSQSQSFERTYPRNYPNYWDSERGQYHASTPVEPRQREYRYHSSQASSYDYPPPSPQPSSRYPPSAVVQVSHSNRPPGRSARSNSYHANSRPVSFHGMMPSMGMMYGQSPVGRYDHGPPLSSSAYANSPAYPPAPPSFYSQQQPYYPFPDATSPPEHQERSLSRPREKHRARRPSVFEPPAIDYGTSEDEEEDDDEEDVEEESLEPTPPPPPPGPPRQGRPRLPSHSHDRGEDDYYRSMPRPPLKHKAPPQIIQKRPELPRKSATTGPLMSDRHPSRSLDLTELRDVLPEYRYRGSSGGTIIPERNRSLRGARRPSTAYHDSSRSAARVAVENSSRRRGPTIYDYSPGDELDEKQRDVEEYQASQSSKTAPVPMSLSDALLKAKASSQNAGSDSGSQKSRSASSHGSGSDARTRSGSGALTTTKPEDDDNIVMTMNGVTMSFTQESVGGKRISVRTGQTGAVELNIEGKRPKKYLTGGSEYTAGSNNSARKTDRKSDRASRRSSRSTYNGRY